jgi:molybdopterin molybdotransferase
MSSSTEALQRITLLTPLDKILSRVDALIASTAARDTKLDMTLGATLAADVVAPFDLPPVASALRDGWAVAWERTTDASSYNPIALTLPLHWVEVGQPMPAGTDAVLPADVVAVTEEKAEVSASVAPFEGVLPAYADAKAGMILRKAGDVIRPVDIAILRALGIETVSVRMPRVKILSLSVAENDIDSITPMIAQAVKAKGGVPHIIHGTLDASLFDSDCDAVITIGGTGAGRRDAAVKTLARFGKVEFHGFGISPGTTAAFGSVNKCPVLMVPGRFDAALSAFLLVGSRMMEQLCGTSGTETGLLLNLTKKVTSIVGLVEVVPVRRVADGVEPLGTGMFPMQIFLQADGWILVPAGSEGLAAGTAVEVREFQ